MANLKHTPANADAIVRSVERAAEHAHADITRSAKDAIEQVREAASALATLPMHTEDLLIRASVALVKDVDLDNNKSRYNVGYVELRLGGDLSYLLAGHGSEAVILPGKYRILLFVVPR